MLTRLSAQMLPRSFRTLFLALSAALQQALDLAVIDLQDHVAICCGLRDKHGPPGSLGCGGLGTIDGVEGGDA